jgi:membrane fusion protein, copper/silver efflux system
MVLNISKTSLLVFALVFIFTNYLSAQDSSNNGQVHKHEMEMKHNKMNMDMSRMTDSTTTLDSSVVRKGIIDLKAIDKNKDGKVYQDVMDFNVVSDTPGKCPLCGMTLKEVSLKKAKETLLKNGFKVKK